MSKFLHKEVWCSSKSSREFINIQISGVICYVYTVLFYCLSSVRVTVTHLDVFNRNKQMLWYPDLDLQCSFPSPVRHEKWKWINLSHTGLDFLSGQMSIQRNYKVGLLRFHCLRSWSKVAHRLLHKAAPLFLSTHRNHIRLSLRGRLVFVSSPCLQVHMATK